ncbi:MAG: hypothetical protein OEZ06_07865 [Myxococcales bacterium]|nr:hypothetical protein [Myxococcales bacterium]
MIERPRHLDQPYASQFADRSVVAAYPTRPPYPDEVFDLLLQSLPADARVLELGCGSGDLTVGNYVESFHSRNGFSRERMGAEVAARFDAELRDLVSPHVPDGIVRGKLTATVVWGWPR